MRNYGLLEREIQTRIGGRVTSSPTPIKDAVVLHITWLCSEENLSGEIIIREMAKDVTIPHEVLDKYTLDAIVTTVMERLP